MTDPHQHPILPKPLCPSTLNHRKSGISTLLRVDLLIHVSTNQTDGVFSNSMSWKITCRISTKGDHINKFILIQLYVPSAITPTLNIHSHTFSQDFCLYELGNSSSFGYNYLLRDHTLYLTFRGLLGFESSYSSRSKEGGGGWKATVGEETTSTGFGETSSTGREDSPEYRGYQLH